MESQDENIGCGQIYKRANIKTQGKIAYHGKQISEQYQYDKLVEPDDLFPLRRRITFVQAGKRDILINRPKGGGYSIFHRVMG